MQVETTFESVRFQRFKLKYDKLLSSFAFNFTSRRYMKKERDSAVRRCKFKLFNLLNPVLKRLVPSLETRHVMKCFEDLLSMSTCATLKR